MTIQAKGVRKDFIRKSAGKNVFTAVHETNLRLEEGKITAIRGRSGSGKTTLLNMIAGILKPTAGQVLYGEQDIYEMPDEAMSAFRGRPVKTLLSTCPFSWVQFTDNSTLHTPLSTLIIRTSTKSPA